MFGIKKSTQQPANPVGLRKDPAGRPAVDLNKVAADGHTQLAETADTVGVSLRKRNLAGMRGRVIVLLDHSGSMYHDYASGAVQTLLQRTLAFGLQIDTDGTVEVIPFDSRVWRTERVDLSNYRAAAQQVWRRNQMGSTNLAGALDRVRDLAAKTTEPIVCIVLTDGDPDNRIAATAAVCDLARYPVFIKFLALRSVPYLAELDNLERTRPGARLLDNVNAQTIHHPDRVSNEAFAEAMVEEWDTWLDAANRAGVVR